MKPTYITALLAIPLLVLLAVASGYFVPTNATTINAATSTNAADEIVPTNTANLTNTTPMTAPALTMAMAVTTPTNLANPSIVPTNTAMTSADAPFKLAAAETATTIKANQADTVNATNINGTVDDAYVRAGTDLEASAAATIVANTADSIGTFSGVYAETTWHNQANLVLVA
ncbi:MAG: hypothetical protein PHW95_04655 [Patescibacteria group bacterium]|nr:hypothetical protein [Patescibacteria group bacterium]